MFDWLWLLVDWRPAENLQSVNLHGTCHYPDTKTTEVRMQASVSWPHVERASAAKRDDGQFWDPLQKIIAVKNVVEKKVLFGT